MNKLSSTTCPLVQNNKVQSDYSLAKDWIDNQDVMLQLHISLRTLQEFRAKGIIPFTKLGQKIYYKRQDIIDILNANYRHGIK